jgi:S1-C subfamily serine protease
VNRFNLSIVAFAGISYLLSACAEPADLVGQCPCVTGSTGKVEIYDDSACKKKMEKAANAIMKAEKGTPTATLIKQLSRKQCSLKLPSPDRKAMTPADIYREYKSSVLVCSFIYKCTKCPKWHVGTATAFVLAKSGVLATNYHVVNNKTGKALVVMTHDGKAFPVMEVLAANEADDIAIIRIEPGTANLKPLSLWPDAPAGTPVVVISHPKGRYYTLTTGVVSRYFTRIRGGTKTSRLSITADYARGSSGGPVIGPDGVVVGMVSSTSGIYFQDKVDKTKQHLQMVVKECATAANILKLFKQ